jgi:hypothetical protein
MIVSNPEARGSTLVDSNGTSLPIQPPDSSVPTAGMGFRDPCAGQGELEEAFACNHLSNSFVRSGTTM